MSEQLSILDAIELAKRYDLPRARQERDEGIHKVVGNGAEVWRQLYGVAVTCWFAGLPAGEGFIGEELRRAVLSSGLDEPHHHNAWGANAASFIRRWLREGRIIIDGMAPAQFIATHAHSCKHYRKLK